MKQKETSDGEQAFLKTVKNRYCKCLFSLSNRMKEDANLVHQWDSIKLKRNGQIEKYKIKYLEKGFTIKEESAPSWDSYAVVKPLLRKTVACRDTDYNLVLGEEDIHALFKDLCTKPDNSKTDNKSSKLPGKSVINDGDVAKKLPDSFKKHLQVCCGHEQESQEVNI